VTKNPYLKRLLGEGAEQDAQATLNAPPETNPQPQEPPRAEDEDVGAEPMPQGDASATAPTVQKLVQQWQAGEHMGVATALMFTPASYKDFVDLVFIIGREGGLELGQLLDELADSENIAPPKTPPQYSDILNRVAGADEEEGVV